MSLRRQTEQRKRRERREAYAQAEREYAVGGPLIDLAEPITTGDSGAWHAERVEEALRERAEAAQRETELLAEHFARRCWLTTKDLTIMLIEWGQLMLSVGPPYVKATHSTTPAVGVTTIPKLEVQ